MLIRDQTRVRRFITLVPASWQSSRLVFDSVCWGGAELFPRAYLTDLSAQSHGILPLSSHFYTDGLLFARRVLGNSSADNRERSERLISISLEPVGLSEIFAILQRE